jgi:hypothetical protein
MTDEGENFLNTIFFGQQNNFFGMAQWFRRGKKPMVLIDYSNFKNMC